MKQEVARKLVRALRSGKYKQAFKTYVHEDGALCPLAVLAKISPIRRADASYLQRTRLAKWAGLKDVGRDKIISWNDADRLTFPQIADRIEHEYETL